MPDTFLDKVFQSVLYTGYKGTLLDKAIFNRSLQDSTCNVEFMTLISFITNQLKVLNNLEESVNVTNETEDPITFIMELTSFLKELGCPYSSLTQGPITNRLTTLQDRLLLLDYLCSELLAARILRETKPQMKMELKLQESAHASDLRKILQVLGFSKPPPNITIETLMQKLTTSVKTVVEKAGSEMVGRSLFNHTLTPDQWLKIDEILKELREDYTLRREMLLTRLDCTIQSFKWSDKTKGKDELIENTFTEKRKLLQIEPDVDASDLLAARDDLAIIEKISTASVRKNTKTAINQVIIGQVPDRGGRTSEQAPPPPEMPSWQQRQPGPSHGGGGGGGGGRGRGQTLRGGRGRGSSSSSYQAFDSAGAYSQSSSYDNDNYSRHSNERRDSGYNYQESKRPRTYDQYERQTYADQYVQDSQHNQQYHPRGNRRGRGRSSYSRGGGGRNYY